MVCLEALACSVPVMVYQNTAMADFVNEKNGLVCKKIEKEEVLKVLKKKDFNFKNTLKPFLSSQTLATPKTISFESSILYFS